MRQPGTDDMRCFRHPDRTARRRCFRCHRPICPECQSIKSHHIFCGERCHKLFLARQHFSRVRKTCLHALAVFSGHLRDVSPLLLLLILALEVGIIIHVGKQMEELPGPPMGEIPPRFSKERLPAPTLLSPQERETIFSQYLEVEGDGLEAPMVALWIDSQLRGVTVCQDGRFSFAEVRLEEGQNRLTVKCLDGRGGVSRPRSVSVLHRTWAGDLTRGNRQLRRVALTFDGGSHANITSEILDILRQKRVKATIFLTGGYIRRYPALVRQMVGEGHEIGNHTDTHPHLTTFFRDRRQTTLRGVTKRFLQEELIRAEKQFRELTGRRMAPYWRAPYGEHNSQIRAWAEEAGYRHISWTTGNSWEDCMDTLDWVADPESRRYHTSEEIVEKILNFGKDQPAGKNGGIVLMHLGSERKADFPHQKLPLIIDSFRDEGYEFVTITQLIDG